MATRKHAETEAPVEGLQGRLEEGFEWINENARLVVGVMGGVLLIGALSAGVWEWQRRADLRAHADLAAVERAYFEAMGSNPEAAFVTEPANADRARQAREEAIADYDRVIGEHAGSVAARGATIRAAEAEVDLGLLEAAETRLAAAADWDVDDALTGTAQRLRGYVLEEQGRAREAAAAYAQAASSQDYPARAAVWLAAAESFAEAGEIDEAIAAFQEVIAADAGYAERNRVADRLDDLQALSPVASAP